MTCDEASRKALQHGTTGNKEESLNEKVGNWAHTKSTNVVYDWVTVTTLAGENGWPTEINDVAKVWISKM